MELKIIADDKIIKKMNRQINYIFQIAFIDEQVRELGVKYQKNVHHGMRHTKDLLALSKELVFGIGKEKEIDWTVLTMSIILHDVFADEDKGIIPTHGKKAAIFFNNNFKNYFTEAQCSKIIEAISNHDNKSVSSKPYRDTLCLESKILYDVDNLDAFGIKGFYRYICIYTKKGISFKKILDNVESRYQSLNFDLSRKKGEKGYNEIIKLCKDYSYNRDPELSHIIGFIAENHEKSPTLMSLEAMQIKIYFPGEWDKVGSFRSFFEELLKIYSEKY